MSTVRDEFASIGGSDGTTPPGEPSSTEANHSGAVFDNPHYQRHYSTAPPLIWTSGSASGRTFTGIDPSLLTRTPPPPPPRTQTETLPARPPSVQVGATSQRYHPYSGANSRPGGQMPVNGASFSAQPRITESGLQRQSPHNDRVQLNASQAGGTTSQQQHRISQDRAFNLDQARSNDHSQTRQTSFASQMQSQGSAGHWQSIPLEGEQPSTDYLSAGITASSSSPPRHSNSHVHGVRQGQSGSHPAAKPHPLQHLVDIHNAGPVSAFSRDPSTFTGTKFIVLSKYLHSVGISSEWGLCLWARGSVECERAPSRGCLPPVFF